MDLLSICLKGDIYTYQIEDCIIGFFDEGDGIPEVRTKSLKQISSNKLRLFESEGNELVHVVYGQSQSDTPEL